MKNHIDRFSLLPFLQEVPGDGLGGIVQEFPLINLPSDNLTTEPVKNQREIKKLPLDRGRQIGNIQNPDPIGCGGTKRRRTCVCRGIVSPPVEKQGPTRWPRGISPEE